MSIAAAQLRRTRNPRLEALDPRDLDQAVGLIRRQQLSIARDQVERNQRMARIEDHSSSTSALLLGALLVALGFDPVANDPAELELGVTADHCRRYVGIER